MTVKKKIAISMIIVGIATTLVVYFIILPTIQDIKKISDGVYNERMDLEKKYLRGQLLKKTIENFEKVKPEKDRLSSIFIKEGEELKFITKLEEIAAFHNLKQDLGLQAVKDGGSGFHSVPSGVSVQGEFINILKYLKDLQQLNYYFNIFSITINSAGEEDSITANLQGEIYALSAEE